ncbi:MAG: DUF4124 domain-containing protein [Chromatiaceae bacterium]|nr:DUF4124 domain-containing protein [Chromatiaceae bacterium]
MRYMGALACAWLALPAIADVYRWTDAQGQVHYASRPPPSGAARVDLPAATTPPAAPDIDAAQRRERQQRMLDAYEYERGRKQAEAARAAEARAANAARCRSLRTEWRRLSYPGPIYVKRADGGRDYLSDEQREGYKTRLRPAYLEACGEQP